jgi:hypothetical protein
MAGAKGKNSHTAIGKILTLDCPSCENICFITVDWRYGKLPERAGLTPAYLLFLCEK